MKHWLCLQLFVVGLVGGGSCEGTEANVRVPWTTSRIHGTPEPPPPYVVERLFPELTFDKPLDLEPIPGTKRLVVVEQSGRLWSFEPESVGGGSEVFGELSAFDAEINLAYGIAFHPRFAENRLVFIRAGRNKRAQKNLEEGSVILRFRVTDETVPKLDLGSGTVIFSWLAGGHEGGNLRFGPDGMLYLTTGDGDAPDPPDSFVTGQNITDVLSSILRIDVDHPEEGKPYGIPRDNPFLQIPKARGEVWAYGLRNPWRLTFNSNSGDLFVGEVGWELWESIVRVERGGNYGWSITEAGKQDVRTDRLRGPTPILKPLVTHSHEEAASITGGVFYYGKKFADLAGAYVYGDWQMGTIWGLETSGNQVLKHRELCRSSLMPVGFGVDHEGEMILLDYSGGGLWGLKRNPLQGASSPFPVRLSETGLFKNTQWQTPSPGVRLYQINAERWADYATSERWVAFPEKTGSRMVTQSRGAVLQGNWELPAGGVLAKTYSLEMERGNPKTQRRIETQVLHFDGNLCGLYTYRWNAEQTDAELVPPQGAEAVFTVRNAEAPGGEIRQRWRFLSRSECARCHTMWTGFAGGFNKYQLDVVTASAPGRQADELSGLGFIPDEKVLPNPHGTSGTLEARARAYLHANCGSCHRTNGGGVVPSLMNIEMSLKDARLIESNPVQGDLGLPDARVIAKGDPERSVLLFRMTTAGRGHMPYAGSSLVDERGVRLIRDWITSLKPNPIEISEKAREQREAEKRELERVKAGDLSGLKRLLSSNSGAFSVALALIDGGLTGDGKRAAVAMGASHEDALCRGLFERFLPEAQRRAVMGSSVDATVLIKTKGDAAQGRRVFVSSCGSCHRLEGEGVEVGPDLKNVATKWSRTDLLEQILFPGKVVEPAWQLATVVLKSGETKAGFMVSKTDQELVLRQLGGVQETLKGAEVQRVSLSPVSLMPEGLLQNLTLQEAGDLLEYLGTLK